MGINNLNNQANFGKLTTGNVNNNKNVNANVQINKAVDIQKTGVLNSATLGDGVGEKFDSNAYGNTTCYAAAPKKGFWQCINDAINKRDKDPNMRNYIQNSHDAMGVVLAGFVDGVIDYFRQ